MESTIDKQLVKMREILEQQERDKGKGNGTLGGLLGKGSKEDPEE